MGSWPEVPWMEGQVSATWYGTETLIYQEQTGGATVSCGVDDSALGLVFDIDGSKGPRAKKRNRKEKKKKSRP